MNKKINKIADYLLHPRKIIFYLGIRGHFKFLDDKSFIKLMYWCRFKEFPNLDNPVSYNEKLQWLKLNYYKNEFQNMVDKYEVKKYVGDIIGEEYIIPTYGVYNNFDEIDFSKLPDQFVIKCTHDSGGVVICKDKNNFDVDAARKKLNKSLKKNYYWAGRERQYKNIFPRIIAEAHLVDESNFELKDYKVLCFDGEPKLIELHSGRFSDNPKQDFYDTNWNKTSISQSGLAAYQDTGTVFPKPETLDEMLKLSRKLAEGFPHLRIDWYSIKNKLYIGELTFYDGSGFDPYDNKQDDIMMGSWITLPEKNV